MTTIASRANSSIHNISIKKKLFLPINCGIEASNKEFVYHQIIIHVPPINSKESTKPTITIHTLLNKNGALIRKRSVHRSCCICTSL